MSLAEIRLDDKYRLATGHLYLTGTQALTRLPMLQHQRDQVRAHLAESAQAAVAHRPRALAAMIRLALGIIADRDHHVSGLLLRSRHGRAHRAASAI